MKKLIRLIPIVLFVGILFAANWTHKKITWSSGSVLSSALITSGADTSDVFDLTRRGKGGREYPAEVSFLMKTIEGTNTADTDVIFTLDLSTDKSVWYANGTLANITDASASDSAQTTTGSKTLVVSTVLNPITSIATTEALVYTYDSTLIEVIVAQPFIDDGDSSAWVTSVANTRADTYTYTYGVLPQYRYARIRATGNSMSGDTVTCGVDMTRLFK